jgi:hypothetical protein
MAGGIWRGRGRVVVSDSPAALADRRQVEPSRVAGRAWGLLTERPAEVIGLCLVISTIPSLLMQWGQVSLLQSIARAARTPDRQALVPLYSLATTLPRGVVEFGLFNVVVAAMAWMLAGVGDERRRGLDGAAAAAGRAAPLFVTGAVIYLGVEFGSILLLVPGLWLMVRWAVVAPVAMVERRGALESLRVGAALTRNNRWFIFGLCVIWALLALAVSMVARAAVPALAHAGGMRLGGVWANLAMNLVFNVLSTPLTAVTVVSLYFELRRVKGGLSDATAAVFD